MGGKAPSMTNPNAVMDHNPAVPFGKPHDTGSGGIPLKFMENVNGHGYGKAGGGTKIDPSNTAGLSSPSAQGPTRSVERVRPPSGRK
jgi:hypothetical protein